MKSKTRRRVFKKTPGSSVVVHVTIKAPNPARCAKTGQILHGVPKKVPSVLKRLPRSQRRPERPFGGVLSSKAAREIHKLSAREEA